MIVIDASAFLELLLRTPMGLAVESVLRGDRAATPHLFDAEVLNCLVRLGRGGVLDAGEVDVAITDLRDAPITRVDQRPLLGRARALSVALSGYDALYAALAEELGCVLVTGDAGLAATARSQFGLAVADLP